jgi:hypothetical protein
VTQREIKAFVEWARKKGAVRVKAGEVEVVFAEPVASQSNKPSKHPDGLTQEEIAAEAKRQREGLLYGSS